MKKAIYGLTLISTLMFSACYEDESSLGTGSVNDITITQVTEETISIPSFQGINLKDIPELKPEITSIYAESELNYNWYLFEKDAESENGYKDFLIASGKELDYEVNLLSGSYILLLEVSSDSFTQTATYNLSVATSTAKGFYILKETANGNTELDLYNETGLSADLIEGYTGEALQGKPLNLTTFYNGEFIDPIENVTSSGNIVYAFTQDGKFKGFRSEDFTEVFNNDNLLYSGVMPADETPYTFAVSLFSTFFFSSKGVYSAEWGSVFGSSPNTGKMGYSTDNGASQYVQMIDGGMNFAYWNNTTHTLNNIAYNAISATPYDMEDLPTDMECINSGCNYVGGSLTSYFLCEQPSSGDRYLLFVSTSSSIDQIIKLDPSLHIAKSNLICTNGLTANYIYSVDENKVYAYSWLDGIERAINLPGIPESETITYISNQYLNFSTIIDKSYNFDKFIVATQNGENYKLYFYDKSVMNGGAPIGEPTEQIEGTGTVKGVRFMAPISNFMGMDLTYCNNPYPLCD